MVNLAERRFPSGPQEGIGRIMKLFRDSRRDSLPTNPFENLGQLPPLLSTEEQFRLARLIKEGDENAKKQAKEELILSNLRLTLAIASFMKKFSQTTLPLMDIIQAGNEGLIKAINKFDLEKKVKPSTYATFWIIQSIQRAIAYEERTIKVPLAVQLETAKLKRIEEKYSIQREQLNKQILSEELGITQKKFGIILKAIEREFPLSLDQPLKEGEEEFSLGDLISDGSDTIEKTSVLKDLKRQIAEILPQILNERECQIITLKIWLKRKNGDDS